ncbi:hypothetical protein D5F01_LYC20802 [Larimichthys crocea]|uniref:DRBM domain-containing protein n=1 Tax=Larimichthys crocea TaxID=215358 RepID=A0A6G0HLX6_LARCR|nr:hypothetical protein D5F01_LYC20802 [Larimichthys crocea]
MATGLNLNWCAILKEYADMKKVSYDYSDMCSSGPQHDLTFHVKVNLGIFTAKGTGKTKGAAKDQAAQLLMELINPGSNNPQGDISTRKGHQRDNINFVRELQELCQRKKWPLPVYEEEAWASRHTCRCKVKFLLKENEEYAGYASIHVEVSGKSKRVVKERATENVLKLVANAERERALEREGARERSMTWIKEDQSTRHVRDHIPYSS